MSNNSQHATALPNAEVYYKGNYWNDFDIVRSEINRRVSGCPQTNWHIHFQRTHPLLRFEKALAINCGNGWVERDIFKTGLFSEVVGVDYLETLLQDARAQARTIAMPARYYQLDINRDPIPESGYDLIINHAGCHHIARLDHALRTFADLLDQDGYFINFDYVGPHRNQYPFDQWDRVWAVNETLPPSLRQELGYPHLPTMLATDPTEAVHSELILEFTARYFSIEEHRRVGGAIAYPLLTFNRKLKEAPVDVRNHWIAYVLEQDATFTTENPDSSLFDFFVCRPNKTVLQDADLLQAFTREEVERESKAAENGGLYYRLNALQHLYLEIETLARENAALRARCNN